jgi:hypothetical protein
MSRFDWRAEWTKRPWWMNALFAFCVYMTFIYMPYDMFAKPVALDDEVWFGVRVHGVGREGDRAIALGDLCRGDVRVLEDAALDVAVGGALRRADLHRHARLERARRTWWPRGSRRRGRGGGLRGADGCAVAVSVRVLERLSRLVRCDREFR